MKNVLFATTALVSVAGMAFADGHAEPIALSGSAELGVTYTDLNGALNDGIDFVQDFNVEFTLSGATESGLSFGAAGNFDDAVPGTSVFVSGAFGTLTLGDTDSAYDKVSVGISTGGLADEADYYFGDAGGDGVNDGTILRYDYTVYGFTVSVSVEQGTATNDNILSGGLGYSGDFGSSTITVGLGAQQHEIAGDDVLFLAASGGVTFDMIGVNGWFETVDSDSAAVQSNDTIGVSATFSTGDLSLGANAVLVTGDLEAESFGVFSTYDLGGGLNFQAAVSTSNISGTDELRAGGGFGMSF